MTSIPLRYRCLKGLIDWPASIKSMLQCIACYASYFSPLRKAFGFAFVSNKPVLSGVSHLFRASSPTAVIRRVRPIIINSVYRMFFRWSDAHICHESLKRTFPTVANINPSAAVIAKIFISWVFASANHINPDSVSSGTRKPMFNIAWTSVFFAYSRATATSAYTANKAASMYSPYCSAFAFARKITLPFFAVF